MLSKFEGLLPMWRKVPLFFRIIIQFGLWFTLLNTGLGLFNYGGLEAIAGGFLVLMALWWAFEVVRGLVNRMIASEL